MTVGRSPAIWRAGARYTGGHLPSLTSLRWFAALAVFLRHGERLVAGTAIGPAYSHIAPQGATGVSFFFMLSGFVLAWTYRPGDTARGFYRRRIARIVPAYLVVSAVALVFVITVDHVHDAERILKSIFPITLLQAWSSDPSIYYGGNSLAWSLSVEVFFYALFPLLIGPIMRLDRRGLGLVLAACAVVAVSVPLALRPDGETGVEFWAIYINPTWRLLEFVIGLCLCALIRGGLRLRIPPLGAAMVAVAAYLVAGQVPLYAMWVATTLIPFAVLLFAFAESDLEGRRTMIRHPLLIRLGQWSFAFYLVHQLVLRAVHRLADHHPSGEWRGLLFLGSLLAATLLAYMLFRFVEHPLERRIRHGDRSTA
jgi:peptidoglycan/LPS O-acetylase OafA/YrhL